MWGGGQKTPPGLPSLLSWLSPPPFSKLCKSSRRNLQWYFRSKPLWNFYSFKSLRFLIKLRLVFWKEVSLCLSTPISVFPYFTIIWCHLSYILFFINAMSIYVYQSVIGSVCLALVHILFGQEKFGLSFVKLTHRAHFGDIVFGVNSYGFTSITF